jgi:hypothetical protein
MGEPGNGALEGTNMKRLFSTACAAGILAALTFSQSANADTIQVTESQTLPLVPLNQQPTSFSGDGNFVVNQTTSISGVQRSPYDGTAFQGIGLFDSLNSPAATNSPGIEKATYDFTTGASIVSLLWGSPDTYNSVQLWSGADGTGTLLFTLSGNQLTNPQGLGAGYDFVTLTDQTGTFGSFVLLDNSQAAFEFANVTSPTSVVPPTPLPSTWTMMIAGMIAFGYMALRRRKSDAVGAAA